MCEKIKNKKQKKNFWDKLVLFGFMCLTRFSDSDRAQICIKISVSFQVEPANMSRLFTP